MKKLLILSLLLYACTIAVYAKDHPWAVSLIADSMKQNAHAVVREYNVHYTVNGINEFVINKRAVVTVLDEKGVAYGDMLESYNRDITITDFIGQLYDGNGVEIKSLKEKDVIDAAAFTGNFADDYRLKHHAFNYSQYPYTTAYEIEIRYNSTFALPGWTPVFSNDCATEAATFSAVYPAAYPLRYMASKLPAPFVKKGADTISFNFSVSGLKAGNLVDGFTTLHDRQTPLLLLATDSFSLLGYRGSMADWKDLGLFFYRLNEHRDVLTPEIKAVVHQIADSCKNNKEKIRVLYKYLQDNTRYVSIELGIGGWQTFDAAFVCTKKYGDCKALSNFMMSMLKEEGIISYATIISSGSYYRKLIDDFPNASFNHVILCVPGTNDTTWLECTSQELPAGYLSSGTADRKALICTPAGGVVVKTPAYGKETNILQRKAELTLNEKDELTGPVIMEYCGSFWHYEIGNISSKKDAHARLSSCLGFGNYSITVPEISNYAASGKPNLTERVNVNATTEVTRSGNNLLLSAGVFKLASIITSRTDTLHKNFQLYTSHTIVDTVIINLGGDYAFAQTVKSISTENSFGSYQMSCELIGKNKLIKISSYTINAGVYDADKFTQYCTFNNDIVAATRKKIVLTKL